jgi:uncharacterized membrane protein
MRTAHVASGSDRRPLVTAGMLLGVGLGGFLDGILFHQTFQLHSMVSAIYPQNTLANVEFSMIWDGVFHAFTWLMTVLGVFLLWKASVSAREPWADRTLLGSVVLGWGVFNLVEGTIDHFILQIHHVVERLGLSIWDGVFLAASVALIGVGVALVRSAPNAPRTARGRLGTARSSEA